MSFEFVSDHREYLARELSFRIKRRPLYSQRAFSRDLNMSPSTLTDYLKDRLALSKGRVSLLSKKLGLNEEQKNHWVDLIEYRFAKKPEVKQECQAKIQARIKREKNAISVDQFKIVSDWYHFAFLELLEMNSKKYSDLKVASKSLGIKISDLRLACDRLLEVGLIRKTVDGLLEVEKSTQVGDGIPSTAIQMFHSQILTKALDAIEKQTIHERFVQSYMLGVPLDKIPEIMKKLDSMAEEFLKPYIVPDSTNEKDRLYCFSFQFFDLLQKDKGPHLI